MTQATNLHLQHHFGFFFFFFNLKTHLQHNTMRTARAG